MQNIQLPINRLGVEKNMSNSREERYVKVSASHCLPFGCVTISKILKKIIILLGNKCTLIPSSFIEAGNVMHPLLTAHYSWLGGRYHELLLPPSTYFTLYKIPFSRPFSFPSLHAGDGSQRYGRKSQYQRCPLLEPLSTSSFGQCYANCVGVNLEFTELLCIIFSPDLLRIVLRILGIKVLHLDRTLSS